MTRRAGVCRSDVGRRVEGLRLVSHYAPLARRASISCAHADVLTCDVVVNVLPASPPTTSLSCVVARRRRRRRRQSVRRRVRSRPDSRRASSNPRAFARPRRRPRRAPSARCSPFAPLPRFWPSRRLPRVVAPRRARAFPRVAPCSSCCCSARVSAAPRSPRATRSTALSSAFFASSPARRRVRARVAAARTRRRRRPRAARKDSSTPRRRASSRVVATRPSARRERRVASTRAPCERAGARDAARRRFGVAQ